MWNTFIFTAPVEVSNPCEPSPCGQNALCQERNGAGSCKCLDDYQGNPYEGCRPECVLSSDCPTNKACSRNRCVDPCPGVCGFQAQCSVVNHIPTCTCLEGYEGDPFTTCQLQVSQGMSIFVVTIGYDWYIYLCFETMNNDIDNTIVQHWYIKIVSIPITVAT